MKKYSILLLALIYGIAYAQNDPMDGTRTLTEDERIDADTYIHEGLTQDAIDSACQSTQDRRRTYNDLCSNDQNAFARSGAQAVETMIPIASQAYSMFSNLSSIGGTGGAFTRSVSDGASEGATETATEAGEQGSNEADEKNVQDYCQYIPMVTELAAQAYQAIQTNQIDEQFNGGQENSEDPVHARNKKSNRQIESMHAVAATQKQRSRAALIQTSGWGATSACYIGYMLTPSMNIDAKMVLKMSSAVLLTTFYGLKTNAHMRRHDAIMDLIASLPQQGHCNPHTETTCFCNTKSSATSDAQNFAKYCIPKAFKNRDPNNAFVCINQQRQVDTECNCASDDTCFDKRLRDGALSIGLGPSSIKDTMQNLRPISKGLGGNEILANANRSAAMAKKLIQKHVGKIRPHTNLNDSQTKIAKEMVKMGVPAIAASRIAGQALSAKVPSSISGAANAVASLGTGSNAKSALRESSLKFDSSSGGTNKTRKKRSAFKNPFGRKKKKNAKGKNTGVEVMDFYSKAQQRATITKDKSKHLFRIISHRYQMSAWKRFDDVLETEEEKTPEK